MTIHERTRMPGHLFDASCAGCSGPLDPAQGWVWTCAQCATRYERCGRYLVELEPAPTTRRSVTTS